MSRKTIIIAIIAALVLLAATSMASAYPMYPSNCGPTPRIGGWFGQSSTYIIGLRPGVYYTPTYTPSCSTGWGSIGGWNSNPGSLIMGFGNWDYNYGKYSTPCR